MKYYSYYFLNPAHWIKTPADQASSCSLLSSAIKIGLTSIVWLGLCNLGATLEPPQLVAQSTATNQERVSGKVIFVNPSGAQEKNGNGSQNAPFKTITQALQVAEPNSVIILSAGIYSEASGEIFPLRLKSSVSIQGDPKTRGSKIAIEGGGTFISPTFARQDITILGANQASLTGVTVTNPHPRGYGLWIESSSPTVSDNTFTGNKHDGISITGNSTPTIRNNLFSQNGANGITVYGTSRPEIRENIFEQTGFGINVAQKATPLIVGNRITRNRAGIVAQATSKPVLRNNTVENNTEDGMVAIAASQPDLGTKTQPGGNVFRQNGRYDINGSAAKQVISAFGNQLTQDRIAGNIDLAGTETTATVASQPPGRGARGEGREVRVGSNQVVMNPATPIVEGSERPRARGNKNLEAPPAVDPQTSPRREQTTSSQAMSPIEILVPPPDSTEPAASASSLNTQKLNFVKITELSSNRLDAPATEGKPTPPITSGSDSAIKVPLPPVSQPIAPPPPKTGSLTQGLPVLEAAPINPAELLPVPTASVPIGSSRNQPKRQVVARNSVPQDANSPPVPPTRATALGLRYRVVAEAETASKQAKVRSLVPGAFRTFSQGKALMQAGAFSDRTKADEILQLLMSNGLKAKIEELN